MSKAPDPAPEHQRAMQSLKNLECVNFDDLLDKVVSRNNFEDFLGCHSLLSDGLSRKSAHQELESCHKMKKRSHKNMLITYPDRNLGVDKVSQEVSRRWREIDATFKFFAQMSVMVFLEEPVITLIVTML